MVLMLSANLPPMLTEPYFVVKLQRAVIKRISESSHFRNWGDKSLQRGLLPVVCCLASLSLDILERLGVQWFAVSFY